MKGKQYVGSNKLTLFIKTNHFFELSRFSNLIVLVEQDLASYTL